MALIICKRLRAASTLTAHLAPFHRRPTQQLRRCTFVFKSACMCSHEIWIKNQSCMLKHLLRTLKLHFNTCVTTSSNSNSFENKFVVRRSDEVAAQATETRAVRVRSPGTVGLMLKSLNALRASAPIEVHQSQNGALRADAQYRVLSTLISERDDAIMEM